MSGRFWAIIGVIAVVFVGFLIFDGDEKKDAAPQGSSQRNATSHIKGNVDSKVKLVEYGDFQCPGCRAYYPLVKQVVEKYQDRIAFQFRHLPLTKIHNNAFAASRAAEAAGKQGKFWEMHDLLYENQQVWSPSSNTMELFKQYAQQLGLDVAVFTTDFASSEVNSSINGDLAAYYAIEKEPSTPSFFINGKRLPLSELVNERKEPQIDKFYAAIDKALKEQK